MTKGTADLCNITNRQAFKIGKNGTLHGFKISSHGRDLFSFIGTIQGIAPSFGASAAFQENSHQAKETKSTVFGSSFRKRRRKRIGWLASAGEIIQKGPAVFDKNDRFFSFRISLL
ncbi:hypothetical protein L6R29_12450 [Myxococcota bacterium]|nr:hypothetical protein [Myxococcota bacterium]